MHKKSNSNLTEIKNKYKNISREDAIIITSYTCESKENNYSSYRILNKNLVSDDRKNGIRIISKYLFVFLYSLRKLPRYNPNQNNGYLYRCINKHINYKIDPLNPKAKPYLIGNRKTFWGFTSTSPIAKTTFKFLGKNQSFKSGTIFTLFGNIVGYDITLFNAYKEEEILLEPERKFTIVNIIPPLNDIIRVDCRIENSPIVLNYIPGIYQIQMQTQILQNKISQLNIVNTNNVPSQNQNFDKRESNTSSIRVDKKVNIKFIKVNEPSKSNMILQGSSLSGLLKLCLLQELSSKIDNNYINQFPEPLRTTMRILKNNYFSQNSDISDDIKTVLNKSGSNIINFSSFINNEVKSEFLDELLKYLQSSEQTEIIDIINRLGQYKSLIKLFDKEFIIALRESIFEFSVVSAIIIERNDFERFKIEREKCPNCEERILFHGTSIHPISSILTSYFKHRFPYCYSHQTGIYFTDQIDYCWFFGSQINNRANFNKIPSKDAEFTMIVGSIYYDKTHFRHVYEDKYTPRKNEINFAYVDTELEYIEKPKINEICFRDYEIFDLAQIFPFLSIKLKREEYCIIWRNINFSTEQLNNNITSKQLSYIEQYVNYNVYPCNSTEEALKLVKRKKFNKIILISNIGNDYGGKFFIDKARKIICSDAVILFFVYDINKHLEWVPNYKNALIANEPNILERYVKCFNGASNQDIMKGIIDLKNDLEKKYNKKFNFSQDFLNFPLYKDSGKYSDLKF